MNETEWKKKYRDDIAQRFANDVKDHVVEQLHRDGDTVRLWRCWKPGSSIYSFRICCPPGWLFFYGDMGEVIWSRECDMIAWARQSVDSWGYFESKVSRCCRDSIREEKSELMSLWLQNYGHEWLDSAWGVESPDDLDIDGKEEWGRLRSQLREVRAALEEYDSPTDFLRTIWDAGPPLCNGSEDLPDIKYFTHHYVWAVNAIKWFLGKLDGVTDDHFYLQNAQQYVGNEVVWWKKGGSGYTVDVNEAERFSEQEADRHIQSTRGSHDFRKWPCISIDAIASRRSIDAQDLPDQSKLWVPETATTKEGGFNG